MASIKQDISLQVVNNNFSATKFSLLGGTQDPSNGQANSTIFYEYDLTAETFIGTVGVSIQASTVTNPTVFTYTTNGDFIFIIDRVNIFGNLTIF